MQWEEDTSLVLLEVHIVFSLGALDRGGRFEFYILGGGGDPHTDWASHWVCLMQWEADRAILSDLLMMWLEEEFCSYFGYMDSSVWRPIWYVLVYLPIPDVTLLHLIPLRTMFSGGPAIDTEEHSWCSFVDTITFWPQWALPFWLPLSDTEEETLRPDLYSLTCIPDASGLIFSGRTPPWNFLFIYSFSFISFWFSKISSVINDTIVGSHLTSAFTVVGGGTVMTSDLKWLSGLSGDPFSHSLILMIPFILI